MVSVPANTFVSQLELPVSAIPITQDGSQFAGETIHVGSNVCPSLFTSGSGPQYCAALCVNSCPQLNPNMTAAALQEINQDQNMISNFQLGLNASASSGSESTKLVNVTGEVSFPIDIGTTSDVIASTITNIVSLIPQSASYLLNVKVCAMICYGRLS